MTQPSNTPAAPSSDPLVGALLNERYRIRNMIGRGGMGVVYLATQDRQPREVVVKLLAPEWLARDGAAERFDREARSLQSLRHNNIVEMFDYGQHEGRAYLVMEYLDGEPLSRYVPRRGRLLLPEFVPIAAQTLKGIGYAHSRDLVLRDIKPANVMLCEQGGRSSFVKILDFGLAKLIDDDNPITGDDTTIGTLGFIAPEAIEGKPADLRADVYALGVLFYYMLAGRMPFRSTAGNNAEMLYKTVNAEVPPLGDVLPDGHQIPDGLLQLVHLCLEKNPEKRPPDANVMVEYLIDAVPSSLFRLPSSDSRRTASPAGAPVQVEPLDSAISGLMSLPNATTGTDIPVHRPETVSSEVATSVDPITMEVNNRDRRMALSGGLLLGGLGVGAAVFFAMRSTAEPTRPAELPTTVVASAPVAGSPPEEHPPAASAQPSPKDTAAEVANADAPIEASTGATPGENATAAVQLRSSPSGAQVTIAGEVVGVTPFDGELDVGPHVVTIAAAGYKTWSSTIEVTEGDTELVNIKLSRAGRSSRRRGASRGASSSRASSDTPAASPITPSEPTPKPAAEPADPPSTPLETGSGKNGKGGLLLSGSKKNDKAGALLKGDGD